MERQRETETQTCIAETAAGLWRATGKLTFKTEQRQVKSEKILKYKLTFKAQAA